MMFLDFVFRISLISPAEHRRPEVGEIREISVRPFGTPILRLGCPAALIMADGDHAWPLSLPSNFPFYRWVCLTSPSDPLELRSQMDQERAVGDEIYTSLLFAVILVMLTAVFGGLWFAARVDRAAVGKWRNCGSTWTPRRDAEKPTDNDA